MNAIRVSWVLFAAATLFLVMAPIILSRDGQLVFAAIGGAWLLGGILCRQWERRK